MPTQKFYLIKFFKSLLKAVLYLGIISLLIYIGYEKHNDCATVTDDHPESINQINSFTSNPNVDSLLFSLGL